uniref:Uncharacterized protein n=1 Tax=Rhizophora mucronata TaxID=61149 RepID=A0A2P2Q9D9_RHIMU
MPLFGCYAPGLEA